MLIRGITYPPIDANEALELAIRKILCDENTAIVTMSDEGIDIDHLQYIANDGVDFFAEMLSGTYSLEEVNRYQYNTNSSEQLAASYAEQKEVHFGKGKQSCVLRLFQNLLTK